MFGPARSPHLTPCDYFFWGYLMNIVYAPYPNNISDLKSKREEAIATIVKVRLENGLRNMENCIRFVLEEEGGHSELFLK